MPFVLIATEEGEDGLEGLYLTFGSESIQQTKWSVADAVLPAHFACSWIVSVQFHL